MRPFETRRWTGIDGVALLVGGVGVLLQQPAVLLMAVVGVGFAAYARSGTPPTVSLDITRELSDESPEPGDDVTVTVRVENTGDGSLADLRIVDGVPPALEVTEGTARLGTALRPGKSAVFAYDVTATRGKHEWEPTQVIARDPSGSIERSVEVHAETTLRCLPELGATAELPLRGLTTQYTGRVATDVAGVGVEFYATREYRPGDPLSRIDWNRYAREGELSTLQFREERAANVVLVVDTRESAYVAPDPDAPNAVERSVDAASRAFTALLGSGDRVGVAAFGPEPCWLPPSTGDDHRARARKMLATHPGFAPTPPENARFFPSIRFRRLRRRFPADAQVLLFSPLVDDVVVRTARQFDAHGHLVTVISPDPTGDDTVGHTLARVERRNRISALRRAGVHVLDWGEESLATELARAERRWNR
jgi:uncharacterized repeat protein (TIGR01451 family)